MYYNDSVNSTVNGMIIKPDGTNLSSFDLGNMTISPFGGSYTVSITVNATLKAGGPVSQTVSNYSLTAATSLTAMGMNFGAFNDVTQLSIDLTVASSQVWTINFDNITIPIDNRYRSYSARSLRSRRPISRPPVPAPRNSIFTGRTATAPGALSLPGRATPAPPR
jgi:hypothetical protein